MNAGKVSDEIKDAIAYNNAKSINVSLYCKEETGTIFPQPTYQAKLGYNFEVQFIPNTDNCLIKNPAKILHAVSRIDSTQSRDDCVEFTVAEQTAEDKKAGLYRIKVKIIKDSDDIRLEPECIERPRIISTYPEYVATGVNINTPIEITFNMPVDNAAFDTNAISVTSGAADMSTYFEAPAFNAEKTTVVLYPNTDDLISYMESEHASFVDISVSVGTAITSTVDELVLPLTQIGKNNFTVRYKPVKEETAPVKEVFFVTRNQITVETASTVSAEERFTQESFITDDEEDTRRNRSQIIKNRSNGIVYIYGRYYDKESGVRSVIVQEQRTHDWYTCAAVSDDPYSKTYNFNSENTEFVIKGNGYTEFCIKHTIKSEDGAVDIKVTVADGCNNKAEVEQLTTIVRRSICLNSYLTLYNLPRGISTSNPLTLETYNPDNHTTITFYDYDSDKVINNHDYEAGDWLPSDLCELFFAYVGITADQLTVSAEYKDRNGTIRTDEFIYDKEAKSRSLKLQVDSINDLELKIIVVDDIGLRGELIFDFPPTLAIAEVSSDEGHDEYKNVKFCGTAKADFLELYVLETDSNYNTSIQRYDVSYIDGVRLSAPVKIYSDKTYKVFSCTKLSGGTFRLAGDEQQVSVPSQASIDAPTITKHTIETYNNPEGSSPGWNVKFTIANRDDYDVIFIFGEGLGPDYPTNPNDHKYLANHYYKEGEDIVCCFDTADLFKYNYTISCYGIKDGQKTKTGSYTNLKRLTAARYDNVRPRIILERTSSEKYTATLIDNESKPDFGILSIGDESFILKADNEYTCEIPITIIYDNTKFVTSDGITTPKFFYYFKGMDKAGNVTEATGSQTLDNNNLIPNDIRENKNSSWVKFKVLNDDLSHSYTNGTKPYWNLSMNTLQSDGTWTKTKKSTYDGSLSMNSVESSSNYEIFTFINLPFPSNSFIEVITEYIGNEYKDCYYSYPYYFYTGDIRTGAYNDLWEYDNTGSSLSVISDNPVFVHTLYSLKTYDECKNWEINDWEYYYEGVGDTYIALSNSNHSAQYDIPLDEIPAGSCYCVIAHYANNTAKKSSVMQK